MRSRPDRVARSRFKCGGEIVDAVIIGERDVLQSGVHGVRVSVTDRAVGSHNLVVAISL